MTKFSILLSMFLGSTTLMGAIVIPPINSLTEKINVTNPAVEPTDSLSLQVVGNGVREIGCQVYFYVNKSDIVSTLHNNELELTKLDHFISEMLDNPTVKIVSINLCGTCSMEDSWASNTLLAKKRVNSVLDYLERKHRLSSRYNVKLSTITEDWTTLRNLVDSCSMPWRDRVMRIIDSDATPDTKESRIKAMEGGAPYRYISAHFLPLSRRVDVVINYEVRELAPPVAVVEESPHIEPQPESGPPVVVAIPIPEAEPAGYDYFPVFAVKTNLIQWAGIPYPFVYRTYVPNISAEYYFSQRWSVHADAAYCYHAFDKQPDGRKDKFQGIASYGAEVRWWLKKNGCFRGLYAGLYALGGDYDYQEGRIDEETTYTNRTGKHYGSGISAGVMIPLNHSKHQICLEAGLKAGFRHYYTNVYDRELPHNWFNYRRDPDTNEFALTSVYLNIVYRFNRKIRK